MYIMFPIAIMYYYGKNLDNRFSVPDFWPKPEQTNRIPFEKEEIHSELERLRQRRLFLREKRLEQDRAWGRRSEDENGSGS
jgi:protein PET100, fungi type